ncbi:MAG: hypothetical protein IJD51_03910 [Clostridia bacterium]|nr:hypothetical protein [Clostridia bacterium]
MKHLKKILIVIVALALIATSVFAVIAADDESKQSGDLTQLEKFLNDVNTAGDAASKSAILCDFYAYHNSTTWDDSEDYAVYMTTAAAKTVEVGQTLYDAYLECKADATKPDLIKIRELKKVNAHFVGCTASEDTEGLAELLALLEDENLAFLEDKFYNNYTISVDKATPDYVTADVNMLSLYDLLVECYPLSDTATLDKYEEAIAGTIQRELDRYIAIPHDSDFDSEDEEIVNKVNAYLEFKNLESDNLRAQLDAIYKAAENAATKAGKPAEVAKAEAEAARKEHLQFLAYFDRTNDILVVKSYLELADLIDAEDKYPELVNGFKAALTARDAEVEAKATALDELAPFDDYDLRAIFDKNYDGTLTADEVSALPSEEKTAYNAANELFTGHNGNSEYYVAQLFEGEGDNRNGYQSFIYPEETASVKHFYMEPRVNGAGEDDGLVFEWDMRFTHEFTGFTIYAADDSYGAGNTHFTSDTLSWGGKTESIYVRSTDFDKKRQDIYGVVQNDVWQHYILTYDPSSRTGKFYVNYEYIFDIYYAFKDMDADKIRGMRVGPSNATNFGWDIDNYQIYLGTEPRNIHKFVEMSQDDQFKYYVDYATDSTKPSYLSRNSAYKRAELLLPMYENKAGFESYVARFKELAAVYETEIKEKAMVANLQNLAELVNSLEVPTSENLDDVQDTINKINAFVEKNGELINKADTSAGGYQDLMGQVYAKQAVIDHVNNVLQFIEAVKKFDRATTLVALRRHDASADEIYKRSGFEDAEIWNIVKGDPAVAAYEESINNSVVNLDGKTVVLKEGQVLVDTLEVLDLTPEVEEAYEIITRYLPPTDPSYETIAQRYASFDTQIEEREKYENSRRIVNCIDYMLSLDGYEATPEFWGANEETISSYMTIIRGIVNEGAYDKEYEGIDEALEIFSEVDVFFYELLQQNHIAAITEYLARYTATESYIEKLSAVTAVKNYLATEDLATKNTTLSRAVREAVADEAEQLRELEVTYNVYAGELEGLESAFEDVLEQQTQYFINTVNYMKTLTSYRELEEQFEIATSYYNAINVDTEEALAAAQTYREYRDSLARTRESSALFVVAANAIEEAEELSGIDKRNAIYVAIKECMLYADDLVNNDADVDEAIEIYEAAVAAYNGDNAAYADATAEAGQFVNATRASEISSIVLAIVSAILEA